MDVELLCKYINKKEGKGYLNNKDNLILRYT
jgi:hypothetical protein